MSIPESKELLAAALERYRKLALQECFDAADLNSRPTEKQWAIFNDIGKIQFRWIVAGNQSGKTSTPARELAWILTDTHPFWKMPEAWRSTPFLAIIAGQDRKMMEIELWGKKLKPFLPSEDWREVRQGGSLQYVQHRTEKHIIAFISHSDSSEKNRKHMQGYVANYVWLDEMPSDIKILEELQRRVDAKKGYFVATFTPKFRNEEIRRVIESSTPPLGKMYKMSKLDNPIYKDRIADELKKLEGYPEAMVNSILYGDWYVGDNAVYHFDYKSMVKDPVGYSPAWRHVESSDPAIKSAYGLTLWAEDPSTGYWYCIKDDYLEKEYLKTAKVTFDEVQRRTAGYNIVRRVCDPAGTWHIAEAAAAGVIYSTPFGKNQNRKTELIKNLQSALGTKLFIASWCRNIINEFETCQWSESTVNKIINGSSYHLLDTAQYFVDCMPPSDIKEPVNKTWDQELRDQFIAEKKMQAVAKQFAGRGRKQWIIRSNRFLRL